jgi:hypothetical protein
MNEFQGQVRQFAGRVFGHRQRPSFDRRAEANLGAGLGSHEHMFPCFICLTAAEDAATIDA